jgi:hypothetical protein
MTRTSPVPRRLAPVLLVAAALTGCGIENPYSGDDPGGPLAKAPRPSATTTNTAAAAPGQPTADPVPVVSRRDPRVAVAVDYALTQATWTPQTWVQQIEHLQTLATGAARKEIHRASDGVSLEAQARALGSSQMTSRATFLGADIAKGRDSESAATVIVVLRVQASGEGRQTSGVDYTVNEAQLTKASGGWRVSRYLTQP